MDIVIERKGKPVTTSRKVAKVFEKDHRHVLESIRNLTAEKSAAKFFRETTYKSRGKKYPMFEMDRDGFSLLVMGFTGEKALKWKIEYIQAFNSMESFIKSIQTAKMEFPALTKAVGQEHEEPKFYHFSNEADMINRIVLGMDAKHFKEQQGIDGKEKSIRPYLTAEQIRAVKELQRIDTGLLVAHMNSEQRKAILTEYFCKNFCSKMSKSVILESEVGQ